MTLVTLAGMVALAAALAWMARAAVRHQSNRLLTERTNEVGLVFTSSVTSITASLDELGWVLKVTDGSVHGFDQAAGENVASGPSRVSYAWLRPAAGGYRVEAVQGGSLTVGAVVTDERADAMRRAMASGRLAATAVMGADRRLGFALGPPAAPSGTVLYRENTLGPLSAPRQAGTAPFHELDVALYASPSVTASQLIVTTARHTPLDGRVQYQDVPVGSDRWRLAVAARSPLVGAATAASPWAVLGAGLLASLLVASVVEVEGRRRDTAVELYVTEHRAAEAIQRSLLPELPAVPGLGLAARYLAGAPGLQVGGDWFDVFEIRGDRIGLVIGDVMGHDLVAASAMSQIRATLRAYAWTGDSPASVLDQLDLLVTTFSVTPLVTVFYGVLDPPDAAGDRILRYANAGHLPPVLRTPEGEVGLLTGASPVIVGGLSMPRRETQQARLVSGSCLVLFTDGLIERSTESLDDSLDRLAARIAASDPDIAAEDLCDLLVAEATGRPLEDDVALLVVDVLATRAPAEPTAAREVAAPPAPTDRAGVPFEMLEVDEP